VNANAGFGMALSVFEPEAQIVVVKAATSITWVFSFLLDKPMAL